MPRILLYSVVLVIFFAYTQADAANSINWTFYGPGAGGKMQGSMSSASRDAAGASNVIKTLDDVRTGKSKYVTLASATVMKGRYYCIGTVTYTSPPTNGGDGKTHTLENVIGYVHDTGCAFNGTCSCAFLAQFCDGKARTDKMDIAVGNFTGYDGAYAMNYITKNPNRAPKDWTQIAGIPQQGAAQNPVQACGGQVREQGTPVQAPYTPPPTFTPQNPLTSQLPPAQAPAQQPQPYQQTPYQAQSAPTGVSTGGYVPVAQTGGGTVSYAQSVYYPPTTQSAPVPTSASNPVLSTLFQQASATSGIRVVQNAAQAIVDLFTVPSAAPYAKQGVTVGAPIPSAPAVLYDTSNISLMALSRLEDSGLSTIEVQQQLALEQPRPNSVVAIVQDSKQISTFGAPVQAQNTVLYSPATTNAFLTIVSSLRTLFETMLRSFSK